MADTAPVVLPGHTIVTELDGSGDWSCSCGTAGSGPGSRGDHERENRPVATSHEDLSPDELLVVNDLARALGPGNPPAEVTAAAKGLAEKLAEPPVAGHHWCVTCRKSVTPNEPVAEDLGHTHSEVEGHVRWITQEPVYYGPEQVHRPWPDVEAWVQQHDGPSIGWDLAYSCRLMFSREADGTITVHVNQTKDPTGRAVTPEQLTAFARGLLEVAGDDGAMTHKDVADQIGRYFRAVYGPDYVYRAPETYPNVLERWMIAVALGNAEFAEKIMGQIEAMAGERR